MKSCRRGFRLYERITQGTVRAVRGSRLHSNLEASVSRPHLARHSVQTSVTAIPPVIKRPSGQPGGLLNVRLIPSSLR